MTEGLIGLFGALLGAAIGAVVSFHVQSLQMEEEQRRTLVALYGKYFRVAEEYALEVQRACNLHNMTKNPESPKYVEDKYKELHGIMRELLFSETDIERKKRFGKSVASLTIAMPYEFNKDTTPLAVGEIKRWLLTTYALSDYVTIDRGLYARPWVNRGMLGWLNPRNWFRRFEPNAISRLLSKLDKWDRME